MGYGRCRAPGPEARRTGLAVRRRLATLSLLLVVCGTLAPSSSAAPAPTPSGGVEVVGGSADTTRLPDGALVELRGSGFEPAALITLTVDGQARAAARSGPDGRIRFRIVLPGIGTRTLAATGPQAGGRGTRVVAVNVVLPPLATFGPSGAAARAPDATPTRVYTDLTAGLAFVLFAVMVVVAWQALRRRPASAR